MAAGNNAAAIAAQVEAIRPNLEPLMLLASVFWGRIEARTDMTPVGSRPTRVPTQPITGGQFSVGNFDGADMGLGSGPQEVPGYISCASYLQASQYTAQAEWSTDSSAKAIESQAASATYTHALEKSERVNKACPHGKDLQDVNGTTTPNPAVVALCACP